MIKSENRHQQQQNSRRRIWFMMLTRGGLAMGGILIVALLGGFWRLWNFVNKELTPLAQQGLTTSLNRPVQLGKVKSFSLTGVEFAASSIPVTATDPDHLTTEAVEVSFNPVELLLYRHLKLDVTLVNPDVYVEQDSQGRWLTTTIAPPKKGAVIKTDVDKIHFRNGKLVLLPQMRVANAPGNINPLFQSQCAKPDQKCTVEFAQINGSAQPLDNNQVIKFSLTGEGDSGGNVVLDGQIRPKKLAYNLNLRGRELQASDVSRLVKIPLIFQSGKVNGDLRIELAPEHKPLLYGSASLQNVNLGINRVPQVITNAQGNVDFQGTEIKLNNVAANYGKIPLVTAGIIDSAAGYNLRGRINAVSVANAQQTLKVKVPFPVAGQLQANLQILGKITEPILSGTVNTIKIAQIDQVKFQTITSKFQFSPQTSLVTLRDIQGTTILGGAINGGGTILLGTNPQLNLNFSTTDMPGDAIAKLYNINTTFPIGNVAANAQVVGAPTNAKTFVQFAAPKAIYPATGEVVVSANRQFNFRNVALRVAGGTVRGYGSFANQRWQAVAEANGVSLAPFVSPNLQQNLSLSRAELNGRFLVTGMAAPFKVADIRSQGAGVQVGGGRIAISNIQLQDQTFAARLDANNVRLASIVKNALPALSNPVNGSFQVAGNRENFSLKTLQATGNATLNVAGGTVTATNIQVANGAYKAQVQANNAPVQRLANVPPRFQGNLTGQFAVVGSVESFRPQTVQATGQGRLDVGKGTITATNIRLANGVYQAQVQANNVPVQNLGALPPQLQGNLTGEVKVAGSVGSFRPQTIQATGQARLNVGNGTVSATNIRMVDGRYQAQLQATNVPVQRLANVPPQFQGNLTGELNVAGSTGSFSPQTIQGTGQGQLQLATGGTLNAANIRLGNGRYQAVVATNGVQLSRFNPQLKGQLRGQLQVAGNVGSSRLADVQAAGQVQLSQGIPGVERPLNAAIAWNGERLTIQQATAPGLSVSGNILANATRPGIPKITALNLNIQAQDFNLQQLPVNLPNQVAVAGRVDFNGRVTGNLPLPNVNGQLSLKDFVVQDIAFEPLLSGTIVSAQGQGLNLNLAGKSDRLAFSLDSNNRPQAFLVQWQQALGKGTIQGDNWNVQVANFPLQILNLTPPASLRLGSSKIAGSVTGNLQFNQRTLATNGNLAIANPEIGRFRGDRFAATFGYNNGAATISNSEFIKGQSRYTLTANFAPTTQGPRLQGKLNVRQGNIQDVLTVAQIFDLQNSSTQATGNASDLKTYPQGLPNQPLLQQIERFAEIDALVTQQQQRNSSPLPDLANLKGVFNGEVALDTANGLAVDFNLAGENFIWGKDSEPNRFYQAKSIIAEGSFANGVLQLRPVRIELQNQQNSLLAFSGNIGGENQSGQLRVNNFPIDLLNNFVSLPIGVTGNLTGTAALAGSIKNPQARGELQISDGTLNQKPVESASASFSYANGRLNFGSTVAITAPQPVNIKGSIPYQLPFATIPPDSEAVSLDLNVENEGLALLNLLTNQVAFTSGKGKVNLTVSGTRKQPIVKGIATVEDATFAAQALPEKIRQVTGKVQFNSDRLFVESLQGKFSRGKVEAAGEIPIFNNDRVAINNPLTVNLEQLNLNLKGLYQGGASGNLQITGSALNPQIGGQVNLYNGQVLLAESSNNNQSSDTGFGISLTKVNKQNKSEPTNPNARFNNLELALGKNVKITRPPLFSFGATGNLTVNGYFGDPVPVGTIRLKDGGVNLFTTQFKLANGYEHTATFRANQPRDPDLDIQLFAKVLDVVQNSDFTRPNLTGLGALETVRVEANIKGSASKLNENLELSSSPARSETEIVSLLGGGFVDPQGRGDSTLGLINIAGSAVFNNFQSAFNQIGTAFGLSELRIFPTVISDNPEAGTNNSRNNSSIELAAEAGVDISPKVSVSSIKILTANDPFQWGINYRINSEFRVRASTNLVDDSRAVIEYQTRF